MIEDSIKPGFDISKRLYPIKYGISQSGVYKILQEKSKILSLADIIPILPKTRFSGKPDLVEFLLLTDDSTKSRFDCTSLKKR